MIAAGLALILYFLIFLVIPFSSIAVHVFQFRSSLALFDPWVLTLVQRTVLQAAASALLAGIIGVPLGVVVSRGFVAPFWAIGFVIPSVVSAFAWALVWGSLNWSFGWGAILCAHLFLNAPGLAWFTALARQSIPEGLEEVAHSLGSSGWRHFRRFIWPEIRFSVAHAVVQAFCFCMTSLSIVLLLGGGPSRTTLEAELYLRVRNSEWDSGVWAFTAWQLFILSLASLVLILIKSRQARPTVIFRDSSPEIMKKDKVWGRGSAFVFLLPYGVLMPFSFWGGLDFADLSRSALFSLTLALGSASLALGVCALGLIFARKKWKAFLEIVFQLPLGLSGMLLALGFGWSYRELLNLQRHPFIAWFGLQSLVLTPIAWRALSPLRLPQPSARFLVARSLGARRFQAFRVSEWPQWRIPVRSTWGLLIALGLGEFTFFSFFQPAGTLPLPLFIFRHFSRYQFREGKWICLALMLLIAIILFASKARGRRSDGSF